MSYTSFYNFVSKKYWGAGGWCRISGEDPVAPPAMASESSDSSPWISLKPMLAAWQTGDLPMCICTDLRLTSVGYDMWNVPRRAHVSICLSHHQQELPGWYQTFWLTEVGPHGTQSGVWHCVLCQWQMVVVFYPDIAHLSKWQWPIQEINKKN